MLFPKRLSVGYGNVLHQLWALWESRLLSLSENYSITALHPALFLDYSERFIKSGDALLKSHQQCEKEIKMLGQLVKEKFSKLLYC